MAEFARTHRRRWLAANRHRLSEEQIAALDAEIRFIVPALYIRPRNAALDARLNEVTERTIKLFDRYDIYDLTLQATAFPTIPLADSVVDLGRREHRRINAHGHPVRELG